VGDVETVALGLDFQRLASTHFKSTNPVIKLADETEVDARSACLAGLILPACKRAVHTSSMYDAADKAVPLKTAVVDGTDLEAAKFGKLKEFFDHAVQCGEVLILTCGARFFAL
jgi:hypothetical protein